MTDALNIYTKKLADEFFLLNPKYKDFVKVDLLNGAKRIFKTIFSIHKKHNFAVIPLNPKRVIIDFDKATLPLKEDVITEGKKWYSEYDVTVDFLNEINQILKESKDKIKINDVRAEVNKTDFKFA